MFGSHNFVSFTYVNGIKNDLGIKNIEFEICTDGLNIYHSKSREIEFLSYDDIANVYTFEEDDTEFSVSKAISIGIVGTLVGGADIGCLAGGLGGWKKTKEYILEIEIYCNEEKETGCLYVTADKNKVINFANNLRCAINQFKK